MKCNFSYPELKLKLKDTDAESEDENLQSAEEMENFILSVDIDNHYNIVN